MTRTHSSWLDTRAAVIALALLAALPLLWPDYPPLTDLPGHMGRYTVQTALDASPHLKQWYAFGWKLIPNLGVDLLVEVLAPLLGVVLATKLVVITIPVLTTLGILWISREVHGHVSPATLFALPFVYGHPFNFGFVNYALSMALALNAFALWLRLGRLHRHRLRFALFVPISILIWITHSFGWGVLGLLCFSAEIVRNHDARPDWRRAVWDAGLHCLSMALPVLLMLFWRSGGAAGETRQWFDPATKLIWLKMALRDRWQVFDLVSLGVAIIALRAISALKSFAFSRNLLASGFVLLFAFICIPRIVFGSAYADMRLVPFIFIAFLLALRPKEGADRKTTHLVAMLGLAFFLIRLGGTTASYWLYDQRHDQTLGALAHIPKGSRVASFMGRDSGLPWYTHREEHIAAFVIIDRDGFSNDQWVLDGAQLLSVHKPDSEGFNADPSQMTKAQGVTTETWRTTDEALRTLPRRAFDYIWLTTPKPYDPALLKGLTKIWSSSDSQLYRIDDPDALTPSATGKPASTTGR